MTALTWQTAEGAPVSEAELAEFVVKHAHEWYEAAGEHLRVTEPDGYVGNPHTESIYREDAFSRAATHYNTDYDVFYLAWLNEKPVTIVPTETSIIMDTPDYPPTIERTQCDCEWHDAEGKHLAVRCLLCTERKRAAEAGATYREHPHIAFRNVNIEEQGERVAFVRGFMLALAMVNGRSAPSECNAARFGCEASAADALNDALAIAQGDPEGIECARIDHCLTQVAYAIRQAARDGVREGVI